MFNFTPLLGAQSPSSASQSLLEFDGGIKVLIDAGWDESFDVEKLKEIEKYVDCYLPSFFRASNLAHLFRRVAYAKAQQDCAMLVEHEP
jgi:cleavage and polyadenylation specificity factor subunit 2